MKNLKKKVIEYLDKFDLATSVFEKKIGIGSAVVSRILDDTVQNPSITTILKIADALDCSLDELFERKTHIHQKLSNEKNDIYYNNELFRSICLYVYYFVELHHLQHISFQKIELNIRKIYKICLDNKLNAVDIKEADWILRTNLLQDK